MVKVVKMPLIDSDTMKGQFLYLYCVIFLLSSCVANTNQKEATIPDVKRSVYKYPQMPLAIPVTDPFNNYQPPPLNKDSFEHSIIEKTPKVQDAAQERMGIRAAFLLPTSGKHSVVGKHLMDASQLALFELGSKEIEILFVDSNLDAEEIEEKLINENIDIVIGPVFSDNIAKIHTQLEDRDILMISLSNNTSFADKKNLFLLGVIPEQEVTRVLDYATRNNIYSIYGILPNNNYGKEIKYSMYNNSKYLGYSLKSTQMYTAKKSGIMPDINNAIIKIKDSIESGVNFQFMSDEKRLDGILIAETSVQRLKKIVNQFKLVKNQDDDSAYKFLGVSQWHNPEIHKIRNMQNSWFTSVPQSKINAFYQRFEENFSYKPLKITALAYDALALLETLATNHQNKISALDILNQSGFNGLSGIFRFKSNGVNERGFAVFEIKNSKVLEIESAPIRFEE